MTEPANSNPTPKREWAPRIWEGADFFAWMRLLARNRFAVSWHHAYIAIVVTLVSIFHTLLRWLQQQLYGSTIDRVRIKHAPIFIVGHWRTGTTLLHELLILDERHTFPNTYQCLEPNHFLLTEELVKRYLPFLMPSRRPMDNMKAGWDRPQEDEFALCMMGQPSPYLMVAFPNRPPIDQDAFTFQGWSRRKVEAWKRAFLHYLKALTYRDSRRLVLKSPTHSCRIPVLLEMFPDARFIHIVRNPFSLFPSTVNLWRTLGETHGLQSPNGDGMEEYVYRTFTMMYERLEQDRKLVPAGHWYELKYEELIRDPICGMRKLYEVLGLGEFEKVRPRIEAYLAENRAYQTNRYRQLPAETQAEIKRRWGKVIERYGYCEPCSPPP
jgi:hypothetical protein